MATAKGPNGTEKNLKVVVFREGDVYVAQCLEYDIAAQAPTIEAVIDRLELTIDAEFGYCENDGKKPHECIPAAPVYYHRLWDERFADLTKTLVRQPDSGAPVMEYALAKAA